MDKKTKITDQYEPNENVKVTVANNPTDSTGSKFERSVTIKIDAGISDKKLTFSSGEDIRKYLEEDVDFDDPQQSLLN